MIRSFSVIQKHDTILIKLKYATHARRFPTTKAQVLIKHIYYYARISKLQYVNKIRDNNNNNRIPIFYTFFYQQSPLAWFYFCKLVCNVYIRFRCNVQQKRRRILFLILIKLHVSCASFFILYSMQIIGFLTSHFFL